MTIWHALGCQLAHPRGVAGKALGHLMRVANGTPNAAALAALDVRAGEQVLELGCGPGHALQLMAGRIGGGTIHAIDWSPTMLAQARARNRKAVSEGRIRLYRSRFEALPFGCGSMDRILAVNVAYFWRDAATVLREAHQVLHPGGTLSVYVTDAATMCRWKFADAQTHRLFDRAGLVAALRAGGFCRNDIETVDIPLPWVGSGIVATARTRGDRVRIRAGTREPATT